MDVGTFRVPPTPPAYSLSRDCHTLRLLTWPGLDSMKVDEDHNASVAAIKIHYLYRLVYKSGLARPTGSQVDPTQDLTRPNQYKDISIEQDKCALRVLLYGTCSARL